VRAQVGRRAARGDHLEAEAGEIAGDVEDVWLVVVVDADEGGALERQRLPAAIWALTNAAPKLGAPPITSPVDFISGPSRVSTPGNRTKGNTAS